MALVATPQSRKSSILDVSTDRQQMIINRILTLVALGLALQPEQFLATYTTETTFHIS